MTWKEDVEAEAKREAGKQALEDKGPRVRIDGGLGGSPVPPLEQLRTAAITLLHESLSDTNSALLQVLEQDLKLEEALLGPLTAHLADWSPDLLRRHLFTVLGTVAARPLKNDEALADFTRRVDAQWGQLMQERPHFDHPGVEDPDDPYTQASVRESLTGLVALAGKSGAPR